jgi:NAD-dependent deacetylase
VALSLVAIHRHDDIDIMILEDIETAAIKLAGMIEQTDEMLGFTGAGISTECGVPDFRSPGSPWMVNKPIPFQMFVAHP